MAIKIHPHAKERMEERGATEIEVKTTVNTGERFPAKFGRVGFRQDFSFENYWKGRHFQTKHLEAYGIYEGMDFIVITVVVKYF